MDTLKTDPEAARILEALENPNYVWRTVDGLSKETNVPRTKVQLTLRRIPRSNMVISRSATGKKLYSTRQHYRKTQSWGGRLLSVLSDQVK